MASLTTSGGRTRQKDTDVGVGFNRQYQKKCTLYGAFFIHERKALCRPCPKQRSEAHREAGFDSLAIQLALDQAIRRSLRILQRRIGQVLDACEGAKVFRELVAGAEV
jgi:hypothetical protein